MKKQLLSLLALMPLLGSAQILTEDFEGASFPPPGWTLQQLNATQTWTLLDTDPINGTQSASVQYDDNLLDQDELLISPAVSTTGLTHLYLNFTVSLSYYWAVDPNDNYDANAKISTDGGVTWTNVWSENDLPADFDNYVPIPVSVDVSTAINFANVKVAFQYVGADGAQLVLDDISLTESLPELPFPSPYCNITTVEDIEPITLVSIANINNVTDGTVDGTPIIEDFTAMVANLSQGQNYPVALEGNTAGDYEDFFTVYVDWNQNNSFEDEGEEFQISSITNSSGTDAMQATGSFDVPMTALTGNTRMRVLKVYDAFSESPCEPSMFGFYGQAEDYTVNITNLGTETFDNNNFSYFPNPVKNTLNLSYNHNIDNVQIFNLLGQSVFNKSFDTTQAQVDMSNFPSGNYMVKVTSDNAVKVIKVIK